MAEEVKTYTSGQVGWGTFLGGPLAATYMLKKNFTAIGDINAERNTFLVGGLFTLLLMAVLPFLPKNFPNMAIPLAYTIAARQMAKQYEGRFGNRPAQSNWKVFFLSVLSLVMFLVVAVIYMFVLDQMGYIHLDD